MSLLEFRFLPLGFSLQLHYESLVFPLSFVILLLNLLKLGFSFLTSVNEILLLLSDVEVHLLHLHLLLFVGLALLCDLILQ